MNIPFSYTNSALEVLYNLHNLILANINLWKYNPHLASSSQKLLGSPGKIKKGLSPHGNFIFLISIDWQQIQF